ncbi:hypothetical protein [Rouxiella badensis]|jgi:hypothetical protein|uniref:Uncharacterized protein n=1 Tax=Rouxiella badensis TaxID=1646377 RepID=A0A1X0WK03_9GAMM|nr:hypothetical protein [Rouxiella badensis]MCC3702435.1 hypothetical protein [Rouxiella badensis]MCC3718618.1 hypothetical protein [Rouxiella badensis]MCC3728043.1 hypothetical protein [Rouxiella badensis]MCC3732789.1 hypothetical protein [Rouxiella badensis]MCC3739787.1 hypothetical protein [Rouxiella badensis]
MKKTALAIMFTVLASNAVLATAHAEGPIHHPVPPRHHVVHHPVHRVVHHPLPRHHEPLRHEPIRHG